MSVRIFEFLLGHFIKLFLFLRSCISSLTEIRIYIDLHKYLPRYMDCTIVYNKLQEKLKAPYIQTNSTSTHDKYISNCNCVLQKFSY